MTSIHIAYLKRDKKLGVYTRVGFRIPTDSKKESDRYPLLVVFDGDRNVEWIPKILDVLIVKGRILPVVAVMTDESVPAERRVELTCKSSICGLHRKRTRSAGSPQLRRHHAASSHHRRWLQFWRFDLCFRWAEASGSVRQRDFSVRIVFLEARWRSARRMAIHHLQAAPKLPVRFYVEVGLMESDSMEVGPNRRMRDALSRRASSLATPNTTVAFLPELERRRGERTRIPDSSEQFEGRSFKRLSRPGTAKSR